MIYGIVSILLGVAVLTATAWAVDRLDRRAPGEKRVAWRPWYRTAVACAWYATMGALSTLDGIIGGSVWLEFGFFVGIPALISLQLFTRSTIPLQALEIFGICVSFALGVALTRQLGIGGVNVVGADLRDSITILGLWFVNLTAIASVCTVVTRVVLRFVGQGDADHD